MDGGDWATFLKDGKHYNAHWGGQHGCDCVHVVYHPEDKQGMPSFADL